MASQAKLVSTVKALQRKKNKKCFDCGEKGPSYVVPKIGIFVCTTCAGFHREVGNRVKGISVSNFDADEVKTLTKIGNKVARKIWMATFDSRRDAEPPPGAPDYTMRDFIRRKYTDKMWYREAKPGEIERWHAEKKGGAAARRDSASGSAAVAAAPPEKKAEPADTVARPAPVANFAAPATQAGSSAAPAKPAASHAGAGDGFGGFDAFPAFEAPGGSRDAAGNDPWGSGGSDPFGGSGTAVTSSDPFAAPHIRAAPAPAPAPAPASGTASKAATASGDSSFGGDFGDDPFGTGAPSSATAAVPNPYVAAPAPSSDPFASPIKPVAPEKPKPVMSTPEKEDDDDDDPFAGLSTPAEDAAAAHAAAAAAQAAAMGGAHAGGGGFGGGGGSAYGGGAYRAAPGGHGVDASFGAPGFAAPGFGNYGGDAGVPSGYGVGYGPQGSSAPSGSSNPFGTPRAEAAPAHDGFDFGGGDAALPARSIGTPGDPYSQFGRGFAVTASPAAPAVGGQYHTRAVPGGGVTTYPAGAFGAPATAVAHEAAPAAPPAPPAPAADSDPFGSLAPSLASVAPRAAGPRGGDAAPGDPFGAFGGSAPSSHAPPTAAFGAMSMGSSDAARGAGAAPISSNPFEAFSAPDAPAPAASTNPFDMF